ncbi:MAG: c-type cytochrome domain-containing protein, partial [Planctomycetota bacterium]|nr:c-type cytochrome domain-containing protein [Planctomycetota bacterium]
MILLPLAACADDVFQKDVLPVLREHCFGCHGPEKQKGKLRLDTLSLDFDRGQAAERWHDALNKLSLGEMPPEDKSRLTGEERRILTGWLRSRLDAAVQARRSTGGRTVLRRLTRYEYANTL